MHALGLQLIWLRVPKGETSSAVCWRQRLANPQTPALAVLQPGHATPQSRAAHQSTLLGGRGATPHTLVAKKHSRPGNASGVLKCLLFNPSVK